MNDCPNVVASMLAAALGGFLLGLTIAARAMRAHRDEIKRLRALLPQA